MQNMLVGGRKKANKLEVCCGGKETYILVNSSRD